MWDAAEKDKYVEGRYPAVQPATQAAPTLLVEDAASRDTRVLESAAS